MKILFDHLCFMQKFGGVPKYFVELIKRLPQEDVILTIHYSNNEHLKDLAIDRLHPFFPKLSFKGKPRIESEFGKLFSISQIIRNKFDIYHQTHYDPYAFNFLNRSVKKVTTIHDMNYWTIPEYYRRNSRLMRNQILSAQKADFIITISNNTKADISKYLNIPQDKIAVIPHGIDKNQYDHVEAYKSRNSYILYNGSRNKYKNFEGFIKSFAKLKIMHRDLLLFCAGQPAREHELRLLKYLEIENSVKFYQATDQQLISLYKGAKVFVFPSFYEGFGLPILEAMASNCPIALSNTSCFPEIAGDAGAYFNPYDTDEIARVIHNIIINEEFSNDLRKKGTNRIKNFSWEKSAQRHLEVYQSLL